MGAGGLSGSQISNLPNHQQLLLYSLAVLCPPPSGEGGSENDFSLAKLWGLAGSSSYASSIGSPYASNSGSSSYGTPPSTLRGKILPRSGSKTPKSLLKGSSSTGKKRARLEIESTGRPRVCLAAAGLEEVYGLCCRVCKQVGVAAVSKEEAAQMLDLLKEMALVEFVQSASSDGDGSLSGFGKGVKGRRCLWGGGSGGGVGGGLSSGAPGVRVALKVLHEEVVGALRSNPMLKSLLPN